MDLYSWSMLIYVDLGFMDELYWCEVAWLACDSFNCRVDGDRVRWVHKATYNYGAPVCSVWLGHMLLLDESWLRQRCHPNVINRANIYVLCANKRAKSKDVYGVNSCCVVLRKGSSFPLQIRKCTCEGRSENVQMDCHMIEKTWKNTEHLRLWHLHVSHFIKLYSISKQPK